LIPEVFAETFVYFFTEDSCLKSVEVSCQKIQLGSWLIPEVFAETFVYFFTEDKL